jgi:hypothetical protein
VVGKILYRRQSYHFGPFSSAWRKSVIWVFFLELVALGAVRPAERRKALLLDHQDIGSSSR